MNHCFSRLIQDLPRDVREHEDAVEDVSGEVEAEGLNAVDIQCFMELWLLRQ